MLTRPDKLALVNRIIAGDEDAEREFERTYRPRFDSRVRRAGIPNEDRQDVVQEVFVTAISQLQRSIFRGESDSSLGAWLDKIVSGKIIDYWRSRGVEKDTLVSSRKDKDGQEVSVVETLPDAPIDLSIVLGVREALERMPADLRVILLLSMNEGRTLKEIGDALKHSTATVHRRLADAQETFRRLITATAHQESNDSDPN
jgi:RNA polymerase sigma factor (sigma-70 family)